MLPFILEPALVCGVELQQLLSSQSVQLLSLPYMSFSTEAYPEILVFFLFFFALPFPLLTPILKNTLPRRHDISRQRRSSVFLVNAKRLGHASNATKADLEYEKLAPDTFHAHFGEIFVVGQKNIYNNKKNSDSASCLMIHLVSLLPN